MKELLELILSNITTHPDAVIIEEASEDGMVIYNITVDPEDMGRVIGKNGKVIRSIRSIAHVVGIRQEKRYRININEVEGGAPVEAGSKATTPASQDLEALKNSDDEDLIAGAIDVSTDTPEEVEE
jgi:uncharacterized protein